MAFRFDLHLHTTASDGLIPPEEIVRQALDKGLACIAVTDHDTVDGVEAARAAGAQCGLPVLTGAEFTAAFDGELHILGYGMDLGSPGYQAFLREQKARREERNELMLGNLQRLGAPMPQEFLPDRFDGSYGRMHMARGLIAGGYADSIQQAFARYLAWNAPAYAPRRKFASRELIDAIRASGGQAVLAHPGRMALDWQAMQALVASLAAEGLAGMEVFYPTHNGEQVRLYRRMAGEYGLVMTYGSDWHGRDGGMAARFDEFDIPEETVGWLHGMIRGFGHE